MPSVITRGNTVFFSFTFYDEDGEIAVCTSADLQVTYPANTGYETEVIELINASNVWSGEWDSSVARGGTWVEYHVHGYATLGNYVQDGKFRLRGNAANIDHDEFETIGTHSYGTD